MHAISRFLSLFHNQPHTQGRSHHHKTTHPFTLSFVSFRGSRQLPSPPPSDPPTDRPTDRQTIRMGLLFPSVAICIPTHSNTAACHVMVFFAFISLSLSGMPYVRFSPSLCLAAPSIFSPLHSIPIPFHFLSVFVRFVFVFSFCVCVCSGLCFT